MNYRRDIDGLRALAVLAVVFGHAGVFGFSGGFVGVDIFFVVSGYLITGIFLREIEQDCFSIASFYERRIRRILPALFFMVAVCFVVGIFCLSPRRLEALGGSSFAALTFVSNFWMLGAASEYFGDSAKFEPMLHTWSLAVEEQFYLFYPLLLWWLLRHSSMSMKGAIGLITLYSFLVSVILVIYNPNAAFFMTPARIWELGLGALLALGVAPTSKSRSSAELVSAIGLLVIIVPIFLYDSLTAFPGVAALLPCLGAALILWAGTQHITLVGRLLSCQPAVAVGLVSYSLYLWHWPILVFLRVAEGKVSLEAASAFGGIVLSLLVAAISWYFVEQPFRRYDESGLSRRQVIGWTATTTAILAIVAVTFDLKRGFPERLPDELWARYSEATVESQLAIDCMNAGWAQVTCNFGLPREEPGDRALLVWGDSHAAAALPGIDPLLKDKGLSGVAAVMTGCPPLLNVVRADQGKRHRCDLFNAAVLEQLKQRGDIGTVLLHARWPFYAEGKPVSGETGPQLRWSSPALESELVENNFDIFHEALNRTVAAIQKTGRRVIILEGIPEMGRRVPDSIVDAYFFPSSSLDPPVREDVEQRQRRANEIIRALADTQKVSSISVLPFFCPSSCRLEHKGALLYRDDNHLSVIAARLLIQEALGAHVFDSHPPS